MVKKKNVKKKVLKSLSRKPKQKEQHNRILGNIFFVFLGFVVIIIAYLIASYYITHFEYEGIKFEIVKEGDLIFYKTSLPVIYQEEKRMYDFYLRNDPRELEEIYFYGKLHLIDNLVLNSSEDFHCDGDGVIAIANLANLYQIMGAEVIQDPTAECDPEMRYSLLNIQVGNTTHIEKSGDACYEMFINDCEILEATEKFMIDTLIELHKVL